MNCRWRVLSQESVNMLMNIVMLYIARYITFFLHIRGLQRIEYGQEPAECIVLSQ